MQRHTPQGVIIACDFTGNDWDQHEPMIEGHKGSIISLAALALAVEDIHSAQEPFDCTLCLRHFDAGEKMWRHPDPPETANTDAVICADCIAQADRAFASDPDTEWERHLKPSDRWR